MKDLRLNGTVLKVTVVALSLAGVVILSVMALLDKDEEIELSDMESSIGKEVAVRGTIVGTDISSGGSLMLLINDGPDTAEAVIDRGGGGLEPGQRLLLKGEVRKYGDRAVLDVPSERSVEVLKRSEPGTYAGTWSNNTVSLFTGTVETAHWSSPGCAEIVLRANATSDIDGWSRLFVDSLRMDSVPGPGDLVELVGLMKEDRKVLCYGDRSMTVVMKAVSRAQALIDLVAVCSLSPSMVPAGMFSFEAFVLYEPGSSRSITIGEGPEGGSIGVRARTPTEMPDLHKGDLVRLLNCTVSWDGCQLRYSLEALEVVLMEAHGPWKLNLKDASEDLLYYIGSPVSISGCLFTDGSRPFLEDGDVALPVIGIEEAFDEGESGTLTGTLVFDPIEARVQIDAKEGEWVR